MGFSIKFNWVLQFEPAKKLETGMTCSFEKTGNRVFPLATPIDLIDSRRTALAKIKIISFANTINATTGTFEVVKIYTGEEQSVLSDYWAENQ